MVTCMNRQRRIESRSMQKQIVYFEGMGEKYSEEVLEIVKERLGAGDIKKAVVASTRGHTAKLAAKRLRESGVRHRRCDEGLSVDPI